MSRIPRGGSVLGLGCFPTVTAYFSSRDWSLSFLSERGRAPCDGPLEQSRCLLYSAKASGLPPDRNVTAVISTALLLVPILVLELDVVVRRPVDQLQVGFRQRALGLGRAPHHERPPGHVGPGRHQCAGRDDRLLLDD